MSSLGETCGLKAMLEGVREVSTLTSFALLKGLYREGLNHTQLPFFSPLPCHILLGLIPLPSSPLLLGGASTHGLFYNNKLDACVEI